MNFLLSLPPHLVGSFHRLTGAPHEEWFCSTDPADHHVGSGGGTTCLLQQWLSASPSHSLKQKKIIIHAGGYSRRLPAYAPLGKLLTPLPVFRWARGQRIDQTLLSLQRPLYERIMERAPQSLTTLIASGDVLIRADGLLEAIPEADVVCYGLWVEPQRVTHHGVFVVENNHPERLLYMMQKPTVEELGGLPASSVFMMDIGVWLLSERAVEVLRRKTTDPAGQVTAYDLYSQFGCALGSSPSQPDDEISRLSVAIVPLTGGEFYHFGTTADLLRSTEALQNRVVDQRLILHRRIKPHPSLFTQNSLVEVTFSPANHEIWIENSHVGAGWKLRGRHVITNVPRNDWTLSLPEGFCVDIVPIGDHQWALRPYGYDDTFSGATLHALWMGKEIASWASDHSIDPASWLGEATHDVVYAPLFPVVDSLDDAEILLRWMIDAASEPRGLELWAATPRRLSAYELASIANLDRMHAQRLCYSAKNRLQLRDNHAKSVFYQLDLDDMACKLASEGEDVEAVNKEMEVMKRIRNRAVRSAIRRYSNRQEEAQAEMGEAFSTLREAMLAEAERQPSRPALNVYPDQIVWSRSPVRIDLAGGWTDTPPYSLTNGGSVVNLAIELNGQPPLQVYVKPCAEPHIVLRSIDLGAMDVVRTYEELAAYHTVGSPFSIPKAALALAGFLPAFTDRSYPSLRHQLEDFGCGIELTLLSAIPAGSGLGTSSILGATVLAALADFCGLPWDKNEACNRTLALEQLLTTGGGWQDQYGGVLQGVKLLQTKPGLTQQPLASWLPQQLFTAPEYRDCHLLYYTGITRTAKHILANIVEGMFLNRGRELELLHEMGHHALAMAEAIQREQWDRYGRLVARTWVQNCRLDSGTCPEALVPLLRLIEPYALGYKFPGAGGGGYLYIVAKDPQAASRLRQLLIDNAPNRRARMVEMTLSTTGLQTSRS
ncbi:MAG: bifunctional fucokinase/L-fucose-1-P-guanylyltransferase [Bacteroidales bacterium]|nr:bifunctional fucokinase/L-fucose-1-P-guanylyltransferase [Bacteroidales bacterium]